MECGVFHTPRPYWSLAILPPHRAYQVVGQVEEAHGGKHVEVVLKSWFGQRHRS